MNNYDPGHTRLKQQLEKNMNKNFAGSPINSSTKKEKKTIVGDDLSVCVVKLLPEVSTPPSLVTINLVKVNFF